MRVEDLPAGSEIQKWKLPAMGEGFSGPGLFDK
jgi:hypothetical protein